MILQEFANFGFIRLSNPASISELVLIALEDHESGLEGLKSKEEIGKVCKDHSFFPPRFTVNMLEPCV